VSTLIEAGADIIEKDVENWTLSEIAREHKNVSLYSILFDIRHQHRKHKWQMKRGEVL
jgi:hypothetical protein